MFEGIILAGGFGTRLKEVVPGLPKPMAPIGERPFLEILLYTLSQKGFTRIILSLGYLADEIVNYFGSSFSGIELDYVVENEPLGTGGAVRLAMERSRQDHLFIFNGDTYLDLEINSVERLWQRESSAIIVGREVDDTSRYGRLLIAHNKVIGFSEKGVSGRGIINGGCYVLKNDELRDFAIGTRFSLETEYLAKIVKNFPLNLFITSGDFIDIGIPEDYIRAQTLLNQKLKS